MEEGKLKTSKAKKSQTSDDKTERGLQRAAEDVSFVPVIVKRTDEARRHPDDVLEQAVNEGLEQLERPVLSLLLSALAAGLILSFTAMAVAVVLASSGAEISALMKNILVALVYPFGFVMCVMSGTQLFTEHTATAVYPVLDRKSSFRSLVRLWATIALGNLVGAFLGALLLVAAEPVVAAREGYLQLGEHLISFEAVPLLASSLLAGWLMALGGWLTLATPPTVAQMVSIYIVTFVIGIGGLHHSIAGSVEIFTASLLSQSYSFTTICRFIALALAGNLLGGSLFVGVLNYAHIRETQILD